jgi:PadR family transcriptional regulator PadR
LAADYKKIDVRPRNWLKPVALVILQKEPAHGYELMERLEEFGFEQINPGTWYRTLRQMEKDRLCESEWNTTNGADNGGGPARRTYSVTDAGEEYLAAWAEGCKSYQNVVDSFYRAYTTPAVGNTLLLAQ